MNFLQKLKTTIKQNNSLLCIGLDTDTSKIPKLFLMRSNPAFEFNKNVIDSTADLVSCYKINIAFYAADGIKGLETLIQTIRYIHERYAGMPVILDAKRADIGNTSQEYVKEVFDVIGADAVTVNPYLGLDSLEPFLKRKDKGIIILCRTSNKGASDFQDLKVEGEPLYIRVAQKVVEWNKQYGNCLLVVGATWPEELKRIREVAKDMFFLVPGIGAQDGDLEKVLKFGLTEEKSGLAPIKSGLIIHSSRAIIYDNNPKQKAEELRSKINKYR